MRGHLSAPIRNGGGDRVWKWSKMVEFPTFIGSWPWPQQVDLGSGHGHYLFSSLIEYYLYTKFHRNRRNFLWTDGHTDGNLPPIVLGRRPKNTSEHKYQRQFIPYQNQWCKIQDGYMGWTEAWRMRDASSFTCVSSLRSTVGHSVGNNVAKHSTRTGRRPP